MLKKAVFFTFLFCSPAVIFCSVVDEKQCEIVFHEMDQRNNIVKERFFEYEYLVSSALNQEEKIDRNKLYFLYRQVFVKINQLKSIQDAHDDVDSVSGSSIDVGVPSFENEHQSPVVPDLVLNPLQRNNVCVMSDHNEQVHQMSSWWDCLKHLKCDCSLPKCDCSCSDCDCASCDGCCSDCGD
jgi:hypothetical protein